MHIICLFCLKIHQNLELSLTTHFLKTLIREINISKKPIRENKFLLNAKFFDSQKLISAKITSFKVSDMNN